MLKPRDEILLDVVGEVLRNGLAEVRRETDARFVGLLTPVDLGPLAEKVARLEALPPPQKGDPGDKGDKGSPGEPGKDGTSVTIDQVRELLDASFAKWALDVERRIMDMAQKAIDRMPQPKDGVDAIGVEDMEFVSHDERTFEMRWLRDGKVVKTHTHRFATPLDEGVWKAGTEYAKGAGVTWGGSWFIAQVENPKGRPEQSPDWRLAVKHGRDGKNGNDGKRGEKGDAGPRGQNLTALMPNGERFP